MPIAETYKNNKKTFIVVGVILFVFLVIIIAVYISARNKGRRQGSVNLSTPVTDSSGAVAASNAELAKIIVGIHADMSGANAIGHDLTVWNDFLTLSNADIVRVYNAFNQAYQAESKATLTGWVKGETSYSLWSFVPFTSSWSDERKLILARLAELGLK